MRVLYVIDSLAPGGAETSLVAMAPGLVTRGIDLHVLPLGAALDLAPGLVDAGATVHERDGRRGRIGHMHDVLQSIRLLRPDLVHTTLFESDLAGRTAARLLGAPSSTSLVSESYSSSHNSESPALKLRAARRLDRLTAQFASRFHAVSSAVAESVGPILGIERDQMDVISRGREPQLYPLASKETRQTTRKLLGISSSTPIVLAVGRLEPAKGLGHLLASAPMIASEVPNAVILLAGREGRASQSLREQAIGSPLEVRFLGHRTDIPELLAAADVLAFPSEREGSPGTLIEAMAVGTPIVASDIAPCLEVLGGNGHLTGLVTPVGDSVTFGKAVVSALRDAEGTRKRAKSARARFERLYTVDAVAAQMADFFSRAARPTTVLGGGSSMHENERHP